MGNTRWIPMAAFLLFTAELGRAQVMPPPPVPGKEYSNHGDENSVGLTDFLQVIHWDGIGGAFDTFDYSNSGVPPLDPDQVDALANRVDHLFVPVSQGLVPFVCSFGGDPAAADDIYFHTTTGGTGVWALGPTDINSTAPPDDVDALELWGLPLIGQQWNLAQGPGCLLPSGTDDTNNYSYIGDFVFPNPNPNGYPPISIFCYDNCLDQSIPYIFHSEIQMALEVPFEVDVDALMVLDLGESVLDPPHNDPCSFDDGDTIIFSIWPTGPFDGGEIWVWTKGSPATFLVHGGRVWDTANPVGAIFGVNTENINAFEAVVSTDDDIHPTTFVPTCFGDGTANNPCPCNNHSPVGANVGCGNSTAPYDGANAVTATTGGRLRLAPGSGLSISLAVGAGGFQLLADQLPGVSSGVFTVNMGSTLGGLVTPYDGLLCAGGGPRLNPGLETAPGSRLSGDDGLLGPSLVNDGNTQQPGFFVSGGLYTLQYWYRDNHPTQPMSPCGTNANFTNGGQVVFAP